MARCGSPHGSAAAVLGGLAILAVAAVPASGVPRPVDFLGTVSSVRITSPHSVAVSADGAYVYVPDLDATLVLERNVGTGELTLVQTMADGVGGYPYRPSSVVISPDGAHVYVGCLTGSLAGRVIVYSRNAVTGMLALVEVKDNGVGGVTGIGSTAAVAVSPDGAHVYVVGRNNHALAAFARNAGTGALTFVEAEFDGTGGVDGLRYAESVSVSPDGAHLYVAGTYDDAIAVFARNAGTGALAFVEVVRDGVAGVDGLQRVAAVGVSPDGAHLYAAGRGESALAVFARNAGTGELTLVEVQRNGVAGVVNLAYPTALALSPDGAHLYVASVNDGALVVFDRDAGTGALTFVESEKNGVAGALGLLSVSGVAVSPDGAHVYGAGAASHAVPVFARNAGTGALAFASVVMDVRRYGAVAVSPDGAHLYATGGTEPAIVAFARDAGTGLLTFVDDEINGNGSVEGLFGVSAIAVSPDGAHVYAAGTLEDAVAVFARNAGTGALTFVEAERDGVAGVDGLDGATSIAVSPDGAHVYVAGWVDDAVAVFSRNAGTGALTFVEVQRDGVGGVDGLDQVLDLSVSPDGAHVYAVGELDDAIVAFGRNAGTGALTFIEVERNQVAGVEDIDAVQAVVVTPDGANVYTASYLSVAAFARDAGSGALTFVPQEPERLAGAFVAGRNIAVSPDGEQLYVTNPGLLVLSRDAGTGLLRLVEATALGSGALAVSPDGAHVYGDEPTYNYQGLLAAYRSSFAGCDATPLAGCRTAPRGSLYYASGTLSWKWLTGAATDPSAFGTPRTTTSYALCLYDESGPPALVFRALAPAGGSGLWRGITQGFLYNDRYKTPEGLVRLRLKGGTTGKPRITLRGRGGNLSLPTAPLGLPLRAQLQAGNGECWESTYTVARVNGGNVFNAQME